MTDIARCPLINGFRPASFLRLHRLSFSFDPTPAKAVPSGEKGEMDRASPMCERLTPETPTSLQALLCCCKRLWDSGVRAQRAMWYLSLTRLNTQVHHLSTKEIGAALAAITVHN